MPIESSDKRPRTRALRKARWECRLEPDLKALLEKNAEETNRTETAVVERALKAYLARQEVWS